MSKRFFSYHNSAVHVLSDYKKEIPLHHYLKQFFAKDKKYGSKDRRWISHFCYCFYRVGNALKALPLEERLTIGVYLCTEDLLPLQGYFPESWPLELDLKGKIAFLQEQKGFDVEEIFPFGQLLMSGLDASDLGRQMLVQPDVFLRIRPGRKEAVLARMEEAATDFRLISSDCIAVNSRTAVDKILAVNKDAVIQDLNSQAIRKLFPQERIAHIWDCCAASGGKTILAHDAYPQAALTVSDLRPSILKNHQKRMSEAGIKIDRYFTADLSKTFRSREKYDLVICDAPCSGSGTWGRNPEELYFFEPASLGPLSALQLSIARNAWSAVRPGGYLLYITCSLFRRENEAGKALAAHNGRIVGEKLLVGYGEKADTLYGCLLRKEEKGV